MTTATAQVGNDQKVEEGQVVTIDLTTPDVP